MNLHPGFRSGSQANNETVKTAIHQERVKRRLARRGRTRTRPLEAGPGAGLGGGAQEIH